MQKTASNRSGIPRIGVVLSSGGVRGVYAHTGFMQAIPNLGIPVAASAGCSAGALVGGFIASGTPLEDWAATLAGITSRSFWTSDSLPRFIWKMTAHRGRGYTGLSDTTAALQFTRDNLAVNTFDECLYPFHVLAVNLGTGRKVVFSEGELAPRMTASAAMPILYDPVRIDGDYYCDGALIDFAPTDAICCRHQLDVVIVNHVSQHFGTHSDIDAALNDQWAMLEIVNRGIAVHIVSHPVLIQVDTRIRRQILNRVAGEPLKGQRAVGKVGVELSGRPQHIAGKWPACSQHDGPG